jgi:hypothetical protein
MKTTAKCLIALLLSLLVFTLGTTQAHAQQKGSNSQADSTKPIGEEHINTLLQSENKVVYYYIDEYGKKKYISQGKTQGMWNEILAQCPSCLEVARKYNIKIYQNKWYVKKEVR